ncbi:UNVERIFIED_CONTAM: hypothetical protein PYX00_002591 [Menopon gallinae]|uniref:RRM domain-containing protein n=1 Tax=Menopon gallinae TaxID=328185 RepID=A0AAW2IJC9_9NEOP
MDDYNVNENSSGEHNVDSEQTPTDQNNLIVNYLPETMTQNDLQKMFEAFGEIESCKLIMNKVSGHSMGYGFVKFRNHSNAEKALKNLDGLILQHKKIKVSFARPANEPIKTANVYVSGLKNSITEAELINMFSKYGKVLTVKVMNNDGDARKAMAIGFVRFEKHQSAENAIVSLDQTRPLDNPTRIRVSFAKQSKDPGQGYEMIQANIINVPFSGYGNGGILNGVIPKSLLPFHATKFPHSVVNDGMYAPAPDGKGYVIFVFNLASEVEEIHLWRLFGPFGAITDIKIVYDKETKKSRGFAFVTMPNYREAEVAIRTLNQTTFKGKVALACSVGQCRGRMELSGAVRMTIRMRYRSHHPTRRRLCCRCFLLNASGRSRSYGGVIVARTFSAH